MKIVIFSGPQKATKDLSHEDIRGTGALYAYYLRKGFEELGAETIPCRGPSIYESDISYQNMYDVPEGDHIFSVEQKGWYLRKHCPTLFKKIKKSIKGNMYTICDNNADIGPEKLLFYAIPMEEKLRSFYVGWAADPKLCYPNKDLGILRILIDHSYYEDRSSRDLSKPIVRNVIQFAKQYYKEVVIRRFISGGVETVSQSEEPRDEVYSRAGLSYLEACEEYRKADIFIVTHAESLGLSVLESAMSGALILCPEGYIKRPLLTPLNHLEFAHDGGIPWDRALGMLDFQNSAERTKEFTWDKVAKKILGAIE